MFARIAFAVPFGAAVTAGLLYMMHLCIAVGEGRSDHEAYRIVDFVRVDRSEVVETREKRPDPPETPRPVPDMPRPDATHDFQTAIHVAVLKPGLERGVELGGPGSFTVSDGEYLPMYKPEPRYPMRALQRRLEGHVVVQFVVTVSGSVRDVVVVESTSEIFEAAAVEAALKFKYKPRIVDGVAIEVAGVQNRITFRLQA